jgi:hypothetical protein
MDANTWDLLQSKIEANAEAQGHGAKDESITAALMASIF